MSTVRVASAVSAADSRIAHVRRYLKHSARFVSRQHLAGSLGLVARYAEEASELYGLAHDSAYDDWRTARQASRQR